MQILLTKISIKTFIWWFYDAKLSFMQ